MKLAKKLSIAATSVALSVAAVSAKPAEAASVVFKGQTGNAYNYGIQFDSINQGGVEFIKSNSSFSLSGLVGVFNATVDTPSYLAVDTVDPDYVNFKVLKDVSGGVGSLSSFLNFSIFSNSPAGLGGWDITRRNPFGKATSFEGDVTAPVPEPMTIGGSLLAIGFGTWMKRKKAESAQKA